MTDIKLSDDGKLAVPKLAQQAPVVESYFCSSAMRSGAPKHEMPTASLSRDTAYQLINDEMLLDGRPRQNLASFVTTSMEKEAENLMREAAKKNSIDMDEYAQTTAIQQRCVNMLCNLYNAPLEADEDGTGTACIGSSEAIMLACLAMKWRWKSNLSKKGESMEGRSANIVFGANVQVCWHKACKYFEIEAREAHVSDDCLVLTADRAKPLIDGDTIGVCPILGSTFNGEYENVKEIHDMVVELNKANGWDIPLHVDAASGGFVAPFMQPDLEWDFRLPNVKSINVSGHKFGLVYAGIGWLCFRQKRDLHPDLVFHVNYLGGDQSSFTLNFSKGSGTIVGQYYNMIRLGKTGYTQIITNCMANAQFLRDKLVATGNVVIQDKGHIPCVAWSLKDDSKYTVFDIQDKLNNKGWIVPAYTCPTGAEHLAIMRVVVKEDFSRDLAEMLVEDILKAMEWLEHHPTHHAQIKDEIHAKRDKTKSKPKKALHEQRHKRDTKHPKKHYAKSDEAVDGSESETPSPPLIERHHVNALGADPTHRGTGQPTSAIC